MAKTLRNIQQSVKDITGDNTVIITDGLGRKMFNRIYRNLVARFDWPELLQSVVLGSQTVANQEEYEWTATSWPVFLDLKYVEILSESYDSPTTSSDVFGSGTLTEPSSRTTYKNVYPPPNEYEWDLAGRRTSIDQPKYFKRQYDRTNTRHVIAFRPAPLTSGYNIRAVGVVEPTELSTPAATTIFLQSSADDALEYMLAAGWLFKFKNNKDAEIQIQRAVTKLQSVFRQERITTEDIRGMI